MCSDRKDSPAVYNCYLSGILNTAQSVGYRNRGSATTHSFDSFLNGIICERIKRTCSLIHYNHAWVAQNCAGDGNTPLLAARQLHAARTDFRVIFIWQALDECIGVGYTSGYLHRLFRLTRPADLYVVPDAAIEHYWIFGNESYVSAE